MSPSPRRILVHFQYIILEVNCEEKYSVVNCDRLTLKIMQIGQTAPCTSNSEKNLASCEESVSWSVSQSVSQQKIPLTLSWSVLARWYKTCTEYNSNILSLLTTKMTAGGFSDVWHDLIVCIYTCVTGRKPAIDYSVST